jgi:glycosyltransferase involved in cell wall biosynthesis
VTVIIPAYLRNADEGCWLDEALDSVRGQSNCNWEIIVVDDGSPQPITPTHSDDLIILRQANTGPGGARNRGVETARGELVAFLDADDRWRPTKLEKQIALHNRHPDLVLSCTDRANFDGTNFREPPSVRARGGAVGNRIPFDRIFFENYVACSSAMMRRDAFLRTPGMSPHRRMGEDYGLWLRLAMLGPVGYVEEVLLDRRQHGLSLMQEQLRDGSWLTKEREIYEEFLCEQPQFRGQPFVRRALARLEFQGGYCFLQQRQWQSARRALMHSLALEPRQLKTWLSLARAMLHVE